MKRAFALWAAICLLAGGCVPSITIADGAGEVRLAPGAEIVLDGSRSFDPSGADVTHVWRQVGGSPVELRDSRTAWPRFVPCAPGRYEFELVVESAPAGGQRISSAGARVAVDVLPPNRPPRVVVESEVSAEPGQWTALDAGSTTDPDGDTIVFQWTQRGGEYALMDPVSGRARCVRVRAWKSGEYRFEVVATDAYGSRSKAEVVLRVASGRTVPVAMAAHVGPAGALSPAVRLTAWPHPGGGVNRPPEARVRSIGPDDDGIVTLDGSGSIDPDGDELTFRWRQLAGPLLRALHAPDTGPADAGGRLGRIEFEPPSGGEYDFELVVGDGIVEGEPAVHRVIVDLPRRDVPFVESVALAARAAQDARPVSGGLIADAGSPRVARVGEEVALDGSRSSSAGGGDLRYEWRQTGGARIREFHMKSLDDDAWARFAAEQPGRYSFTLRVTEDGQTWSAPSCVTATVLAANRPPVVDLPETVRVRGGDEVRLVARAGDHDGDTVSLQWRRIGGRRVRLSTSGSRAAFVAPPWGTVGLEVSCIDARGARARRTLDVVVVPSGRPPVASARAAGSLRPLANERVILDGSDSYDTEGAPLRYRWDVAGASIVALRGRASCRASFVPPAPGTYEFSLTVEAEGRASAPANVTVDVGPDRPPELHVRIAPVPARVAAGVPIVLDASTSRCGAAVPSVSWEQIAGPPLDLPTVPTPRLALAADEPGAYAIRVRATDGVRAERHGIVRFSVAGGDSPR